MAFKNDMLLSDGTNENNYEAEKIPTTPFYLLTPPYYESEDDKTGKAMRPVKFLVTNINIQ